MVGSSNLRNCGEATQPALEFSLVRDEEYSQSNRSWVPPRQERGFPDGSAGKESVCNAGDTGDSGLIPGWGRSPGGGNGDLLQCCHLENPIDRGVWWMQSMGSQRVRHD